MLPALALGIATTALAAVARDDAAIGGLASWCGLQGMHGLAPAGKVKIARSVVGGLGLFAEGAIAADEVVMRIPLRLALAERLLPLLSGESAATPPFARAPWQATLAAIVATEECGSEPSPWAAWLELLPQGAQGLPLCEVDELQYAPAEQTLRALHAERAELAEKIATALSGDGARAEDDVAVGIEPARIERALTLANTRAFLLELVEGDPWACTHAFVPLLDMANHSPQGNMAWALEGDSAASGAILVRALRAAASGEELTLTYDPTSTNDDYALYHGFVPGEANPYDDVEVFSGLAEAIAWHRRRYGEHGVDSDGDGARARESTAADSAEREALEAAALSLGAVPPVDGIHMRRVGVASAGPKGGPLWVRAAAVDPRLLGAFRLLAATVDPPPDDAGAHAALAIACRCKQLLDQYPTSLEHDAAILADLLGAPPGGEVAPAAADECGIRRMQDAEARMVTLRYRMAKKQLLRDATDWLTARSSR